MYIQFLSAAVVCKSENWGFKKAKERWDSASLREDYAKEQLRENMGQSESKERGFTQVLKKTLEARF
jgi:hypothetical protein